MQRTVIIQPRRSDELILVVRGVATVSETDSATAMDDVARRSGSIRGRWPAAEIKPIHHLRGSISDGLTECRGT